MPGAGRKGREENRQTQGVDLASCQYATLCSEAGGGVARGEGSVGRSKSTR